MKKILMVFAASMVFGYASAQLEPKTSQGTTFDTIVPPVTNKEVQNPANEGIVKRNTIESGIGKPGPVKRDIYSNEPVKTPSGEPYIGPRVATTTASSTRRP